MSGGSYEYLCYKEVDELIKRTDLIERMRDDLAALGYARDAARETDELLAMIRQFSVVVETRQERLRVVWRAMEWWHSMDSDEQDVRDALERYRRPLTTP